MPFLYPPLYFRYIANHYLKNLLAILFGLSFAFAAIDYFQHVQALSVSSNYKILYIFYMWQEALGMLYPLALVFALIMTKLALVKQHTMAALHAFGYSQKKLLAPLLVVAAFVYAVFVLLHTTDFSYAKDKAHMLLENRLHDYDVNDIFFKYNDTFVYIKRLDPVEKKIEGITIFKVAGYQVRYTIKAPVALFDGEEWIAQSAVVKTHQYRNGELIRYKVEKRASIATLHGYKPKIIESLYEGKALNIIDAYRTWKLLEAQHLNSDKIRAVLYDKIIIPLFAPALMMILFFKLPFHARMANLGAAVAFSLGGTFLIWGILFGLEQIGANGVLVPELTTMVPVAFLWVYALWLFFTDGRKIS